MVLQFVDDIDATLDDLERLMELLLNSSENDVRRLLFPSSCLSIYFEV